MFGMVKINKHLFCFGYGYVADALAYMISNNWKISGTHQTKDKLQNGHYYFDGQNIFDLELFNSVTHILISIPPKENGDLVYNKLINHIKNLPKLEWIGYLSSTSVYGDQQSAWVREDSNVDYNNPLGKNRLKAEEQWLKSGLPVNILRLSAIYGKNRSVFESIKANQAIRIYKENHYFSRIYIKDLIEIIMMMMDKHYLGEIYNIADNFPAPNHEVISYACDLLRKEVPELVNYNQANLSERMKLYYSSSKKIDNAKLKKHYNYEFKFPSYKEGLVDLLIK